MAVLGIDYGSKRVGVALAPDDERPHRLQVLPNNELLLDRLGELLEDHEVDEVVVGLPRNLDGDDTAQTQLAREFADTLADALGCDVVMQDEADTSNIARERLQAARMRTEEVERWVDAEAAVIILEDYLDAT